jgi:hypothetical protein
MTIDITPAQLRLLCDAVTQAAENSDAEDHPQLHAGYCQLVEMLESVALDLLDL